MLKTMAILFGVVFLVIGALGFVPAAAPNGLLLGVFEVGPIHNLIHLVSGGAAILMAIGGEGSSRLFFQIFGVLYGAVAVLGLMHGDAALLGVVAHNWADVWLHAAIAVVALFLGFGYGRSTMATPRARG